MLVGHGDFLMPSVAINTARFATAHNVGRFGDNLFANTVVDPSKEDANGIVVYFDSEKGEGGNIRTLGSGPAWFVDQMCISSSALNSGDAQGQLRRHVNFLCSVRSEPLLCAEDQIWYRFIHIALIGRPKRVGRTGRGMELYEATMQVKWRPMSTQDSDYSAVTGIPLY